MPLIVAAVFLVAAVGLWISSLPPGRWSKERAFGYIVAGIVAGEITSDAPFGHRLISPRLLVVVGALVMAATGNRMLRKLKIWQITRRTWRSPLFVIGIMLFATAGACWLFLWYADKYGWNGDPHPNLVGVGVLSWLCSWIGIPLLIVGVAKANTRERALETR